MELRNFRSSLFATEGATYIPTAAFALLLIFVFLVDINGHVCPVPAHYESVDDVEVAGLFKAYI